jgi:hypothetical protein
LFPETQMRKRRHQFDPKGRYGVTQATMIGGCRGGVICLMQLRSIKVIKYSFIG